MCETQDVSMYIIRKLYTAINVVNIGFVLISLCVVNIQYDVSSQSAILKDVVGIWCHLF